MTRQIIVNKQGLKSSQIDMIRRSDQNALLISKYESVGADLMGLSWIFAEDDEEWNQ